MKKLLLCALAILATGAAHADTAGLLQLIDYMGVDYSNAVSGGQVVNPGEYAEMREFAANIQSGIGQLPESGGSVKLADLARQLQTAVASKADPAAIRKFLAALKATEARMEADSMDGVWKQILQKGLYSLPDPSLFPSVRKRWEQGLPTAWNQDVINGLVTLVNQLVSVAGPNVVGVNELPPNAFTTKYAP